MGRSCLSLILFFLSFSIKSQLSLHVKELNFNEFKNYIPENSYVANNEIKYQGHILEVLLINNSEKSISLPLDTTSYALPYKENARKYYKKNDFQRDPDLFNLLGIYPFVSQKNKFISNEFDMAYDPIDILPRFDQKEKDELKKQRVNIISDWKKKNNFGNDLKSVYNWYILNNMITIAPKSKIRYKIYFNPFLKRQDLFDYHEFYWKLDSTSDYQAVFKLILNKNLYKFLTKEDRKKFPNLFVGIITSEPINMYTKSD